MPRIAPFETYHRRYEDWFGRHGPAYGSELLAIRALLPWNGRGLEVGVGSGRFAAPLGVGFGIDPSEAMLAYARSRGIQAVRAVGEALPFADAVFDYALIVTTICFVDDPKAMLAETHRVLRPGGRLVIGFIDRESTLGQSYVSRQRENVFYRDATFYSAGEVESLVLAAGFTAPVWGETLSRPLETLPDVEPLRAGRGQGAFVVVQVTRA